MTQALEIHGLRCREPRRLTWFGRLRARLLSLRNSRKALEHCSEHMLRDIGLLDDRRANRLLRDDALFRR